MSQNLVQEIHQKNSSKKVPEIKPGYTVEVDTIIREGSKQRVQKFKGLVIAVTGEGTNQLITVRKISYGVGVEKKLPLHSPNIGGVKVIKIEPTRRSKLYFMRDRVGKSAMRIKKGKAVFVTEDEVVEALPEEEVVAPSENVEVAQSVETPVEVESTQEKA